MNKTKSLLDVIKHKTGETFDVDLVDLSAPLMERTMNHSTYGKMVDVDHILVGFEAEWPSDYIKNEFERLGINARYMDLDDARRLDAWEERTFARMFSDYEDEQREEAEDRARSDYYSDAADEAYSDLMNDYEDDLVNDRLSKPLAKIVDMSRKEIEDEIREENSYDEDEDIDDSDVIDWLKENKERDLRDFLESEYHDEWNEKIDDYINERVDEYMDTDEDSFFERERHEILSAMDIDPDADSDPTYDDMDRLATAFTEETGIEIVEFSEDYDGTSKRADGYEGYYLETDSGDAELISPPQPVGKTLEDLKKVLDFIQADAAPTVGNGLHVTMSIPEMEAEEYDVLKILMFLGEDHLLKLFDREKNSFTGPHKKALLDDNVLLGRLYERNIRDPRDATKRVLNGGFSGEDIDVLVGTLYMAMTGNRYRTFNLSHLFSRFSETTYGEGEITFDTKPNEKPRVEFRIMGNEGYSKRYDDIRTTILRYAYVLDLATNPKAEREEYAKKLFRFFSDLLGAAKERHGDNAPVSKLQKAQAEKAEKFNAMYNDDFLTNGPVFKLGGMAMSPQIAGRYIENYVKNDIKDWMTGKKKELFMIVATIMKSSTYEPNNVDLSKYAPYLRLAIVRGGLGTKSAFERAADEGLRHSDKYDLEGGGRMVNREEFKDWVVKTAEQYKIL